MRYYFILREIKNIQKQINILKLQDTERKFNLYTRIYKSMGIVTSENIGDLQIYCLS